tara:strand:- start:2028 stop:2405 length:378 start_codon:yes stop_codon:yes gene_type:complete
MHYYRKYMMDDLSLLNEITKSVDEPDGEINIYTQTVYVMGPLCEQWVTASEGDGPIPPIMSCSLWSTASAVDILWNQEPLLDFSSSEVWPFPGTEMTTFGNAMPIYQKDYCERFECPTGSAPTTP